MNRRFSPSNRQKANAKRRRKDREIFFRFKTPEKPYYVRFWRKTKNTEKTDIFYVSFSVENDPDVVVELINKAFDGFIFKVFNWQYWYEVQLSEELFWGEVVEWVDLAFKDLFK